MPITPAGLEGGSMLRSAVQAGASLGPARESPLCFVSGDLSYSNVTGLVQKLAFYTG